MRKKRGSYVSAVRSLGTWPETVGIEKGKIISQNKFEMLMSRVMQCEVEERTIRRQEEVVVEYFRYGEKGHKCKECPLKKEEKKR